MPKRSRKKIDRILEKEYGIPTNITTRSRPVRSSILIERELDRIKKDVLNTLGLNITDRQASLILLKLMGRL